MWPFSKKEKIALLPEPDKLALLSIDKVQLVVHAIDRDADRKAEYARLGMVFGPICFLAGLGAAAYLTIQGWPRMAAGILCSSFFSTIGKMITGRLDE